MTDELVEVIDKVVEKIPTVYDDGLKQTTQESGKIFALLPRTINAPLFHYESGSQKGNIILLKQRKYWLKS